MKGWLIGILSALGAVLAIFFAGKRSGSTEERAKNNEKVLKNVKIAKKASLDSASLTDKQRRDELRDYIRK